MPKCERRTPHKNDRCDGAKPVCWYNPYQTSHHEAARRRITAFRIAGDETHDEARDDEKGRDAEELSVPIAGQSEIGVIEYDTERGEPAQDLQV